VVGIITAKDKLLRLLSGVCECAGGHPSPPLLPSSESLVLRGFMCVTAPRQPAWTRHPR
jgi:hypothetical protein